MTRIRGLCRHGIWLITLCALAVPTACATAHAGSEGTAGGALAAVAATDQFFADYLDPDGRVVRRDQGGDTVSEGQAYAMLLAVGMRDETRFRRVWTWTQANLQRSDGLLSWRWDDGRIVDDGAATDADLITAWALGLAGDRFGDPALTAESKRIGRAVMGVETVTVDGGRMIVAGPWATTDSVVNPSYIVVGAMSQLWWLAGDPAWSSVAATGRDVLERQMAATPHLPSDWSDVDGVPTAAPDSSSARFSYDAGRVLVQLAMDCDASGRALAAQAWPFFAALDTEDVVAAYAVDGTPMGSSRHPITLVGAAASAHAAGDDTGARRLLDAANELDERSPTYYGSAWIAIARTVLDTRLLGGCA